MRNGELIAKLAATARAFRVLAVIVIGLASFAHEAATQDHPAHRIGIIQGSSGRNLEIEARYTQGQSDRTGAFPVVR